jgi:hypothetical protein
MEENEGMNVKNKTNNAVKNEYFMRKSFVTIQQIDK